MQDRAPTKPNRVLITPENGEPYYATMVRADEPTQEGTPLDKNTFLKDSTAALFGLDATAVPDDVLEWLGVWGETEWKLLAEYNAAGTYTFTVPADVDELGALILGGGGAGGLARGYYNAYASGGGSGQLRQIIQKKEDGDFTNGEEIAVVVGAGGAAISYSKPSSTNNSVAVGRTGNSGGSSSFNGEVANGGSGGQGYGYSMDNYAGGAASSGGYGQPSDCPHITITPCYAPYGLTDHFDGTHYAISRLAAPGAGAMNIFDKTDLHIYCGAGGCAVYQDGKNTQPVISRIKGSAGAGGYSLGGTATAPGDGGGAAASALSTDTANGAGADGLVLVYGRKTV